MKAAGARDGRRSTRAHELTGALALLLAGSATSAPIARADDGPRYHLLARVEQSYTSNLFHEQARRLLLFDPHVEQKAGYPETDRYHGMDGPSDFVTEPGLEAGVTFKLGKRRSLGLTLGAQYSIHARNPIADYVSLAAELRYRLGKRDSLSLESELVPQRFVKNYPYNRSESQHFTVFHRADRLELDNRLGYRHAWTKRVRSELALAFDLKRFELPFDRANRPLLAPEVLALWNAPFRNRSSNEYGASVSSSYAPTGALEIELGLDFGLTLTPHDVEYNGYPVERSHHDVLPHVGVALDLPARFAVELGFGTRWRKFETNEPQDDTYFDRHDVRFDLDLELRKGFGRRFEVALQAGYYDNNAYRVDPGDDADDFGFTEVTLGVALSLRVD